MNKMQIDSLGNPSPQKTNSAFQDPGVTFVGVGPGDPSLMTLSAVQAIKNATVVAYPISRLGEEGMAAKIASDWISQEVKRLPVLLPMVAEAEPRLQAWEKAGNQIAGLVSEAERVVFLCQGDVSFFASSSYILMSLKAHHPNCPVRLVPGITSVSAAAAAGEWPLALQQDQLLILPTPDEQLALEKLLFEAGCCGRVIVLMKVGDRWSWVKPLLEKMNLLDKALFAQKVGWTDQEIINAKSVKSTLKPYFSLLLIRQGWPKVMP